VEFSIGFDLTSGYAPRSSPSRSRHERPPPRRLGAAPSRPITEPYSGPRAQHGRTVRLTRESVGRGSPYRARPDGTWEVSAWRRPIRLAHCRSSCRSTAWTARLTGGGRDNHSRVWQGSACWVQLWTVGARTRPYDPMRPNQMAARTLGRRLSRRWWAWGLLTCLLASGRERHWLSREVLFDR